MSVRSLRRLVALTLMLGALVVSITSCANVPLKQKVSMGHQGLRTALTSADDLERALCQPAPATPNICLSPAAATIGLTNAKHQELSRQFAAAYEKDIAVGQAIIAWKAGDPVPKDLPALMAAAQASLAAVKPLTGGDGTRLISKVQAWLDQVVALEALFAGAK